MFLTDLFIFSAVLSTFRMTVYQIEARRGFNSNIFLLVSDRSCLIDAGCGADSSGVISRIRSILGDGKLDLLLLTHCHADHSGGAPDIAEEFGCRVMAGRDDVRALADADREASFADGLGVRIRPVECGPLSEGDIVDLGEHRLRVIETPGHTPGGICLYDMPSRALFSGDTVFDGGFGRTDLPGGSAGEMRASLEKLRNFDISYLYPGHGTVSADGNKSVRAALTMMEGW